MMRFDAFLSSVNLPGDTSKPIKVVLAVPPEYRDEMSTLAAAFGGDPDNGPSMTHADRRGPALTVTVIGINGVAFEVRGTPTTQGSKRAFIRGGRAVVVETKHSALQLWRHAISDEARKAMGERPLLTGPLEVVAFVRLQRPASAPKRRRIWPIGRRSGDGDKLTRAIFDALTGVVFVDDAQVCHLDVWKDYGEPGASITVRPITDAG